MSERSSIEWTDATWQIVTGCSIVSPACTNCYAMRLAGTRLRNHPSRAGLTRETKTGPVWTGEVRFNEEWLLQPLQWERPRRIFVAAHGDLFHEGVKDEWLDRIFAVMALASWHTLQVLTKCPARMRAYMSDPRRPHRIARAILDLIIAGRVPKSAISDDHWPIKSIGDVDLPDDITLHRWPPANVWCGVTAEDQKRADERIPDLLATPAAARFVSVEPMLGPVELGNLPFANGQMHVKALTGETLSRAGDYDNDGPRLDWVICGGESGPNARPMHPAWARSLRGQCAAAGVPFFFKQWGEWKPVCEMSEDEIDAAYHPALKTFPEAARRRRFPQCVLHDDANRFVAVEAHGAFQGGKQAMLMIRVGRARAGRLLDGVEHNGFPEPRP
ncbi:phage Gp37/Gp68 family protein [Methylocystis parvus]|uniref:phage Gp37/Gp68 family protein n=1 Tax=Methylocystis parvus TaxID=134 RepID=UPI003C793FDE